MVSGSMNELEKYSCNFIISYAIVVIDHMPSIYSMVKLSSLLCACGFKNKNKIIC